LIGWETVRFSRTLVYVVRLGVITDFNTKFDVFRDVTSCSLFDKHQHFRETGRSPFSEPKDKLSNQKVEDEEPAKSGLNTGEPETRK
jgi:hypothetical protein